MDSIYIQNLSPPFQKPYRKFHNIADYKAWLNIIQPQIQYVNGKTWISQANYWSQNKGCKTLDA